MRQTELTDRALREDIPDWGVLVLESHHSPQFTMDYRRHMFLKLVFVLRGRGVMEIGERLLRFKEGDLMVVVPDTPNRITDSPDSASSLYICCVDQQRFDFDPEVLGKLRSGLISGDAHLANRIATQLRRMRHDQANRGRDAAISLVTGALQLVDWILQRRIPEGDEEAIRRTAVGERQRVEHYVAQLTTEFYEATTIDAAAKQLSMSRRSFTKMFQEVTGETWLTYVRRLMINHAKHQLVQTQLSIASIAFECGFNDLSTFYRQFKSQVGQSPKAYRRGVEQVGGNGD